MKIARILKALKILQHLLEGQIALNRQSDKEVSSTLFKNIIFMLECRYQDANLREILRLYDYRIISVDILTKKNKNNKNKNYYTCS